MLLPFVSKLKAGDSFCITNMYGNCPCWYIATAVSQGTLHYHNGEQYQCIVTLGSGYMYYRDSANKVRIFNVTGEELTGPFIVPREVGEEK